MDYGPLMRYQRAENQYLFGGNTKLEVLNAQVDLNTDSVTLSQTKLNYASASRAAQRRATVGQL